MDELGHSVFLHLLAERLRGIAIPPDPTVEFLLDRAEVSILAARRKLAEMQGPPAVPTICAECRNKFGGHDRSCRRFYRWGDYGA